MSKTPGTVNFLTSELGAGERDGRGAPAVRTRRPTTKARELDTVLT
ncbi:hypothetical protein [Streptomyces sp. NPDC048473]